ncbi:glyoxylase-like metal-dependent hydrolase (beta-lactamase superfamily II) [Methylovorus glucosotrophus]|uniref:MBL fold metallo-hydrolase n=1 Tax=Methylovorus glucosotrophus TaxID=266009 RepID=UPI0013319BC1|nr:MBL fold metallo-hydrolase [Methylovorus glucosotrophus]KAF0843784.1 glyoxylase-like metal-dependent hydrolase (beta-lactamase superfamily II) [Methylovorus glucosotrophus]
MFRQLFEPNSSTYTYLITDGDQALLIDPVITEIDIYLALLAEHQLELAWTLETHVHADHITAGGELRQRIGSRSAVGALCGASAADRQLKDGDSVQLGNEQLQVIATPGHTPGSVSFLWKDRVFTGDSLLINGCGRTDFQGGDAGVLYDSISQRLFTLPDETLVYPGHDYQGRRVSCIGQEKTINPRLAGKSRDAFIEIMASLDLPKPRLIDIAVPANRRCGVDEEVAPQG